MTTMLQSSCAIHWEAAAAAVGERVLASGQVCVQGLPEAACRANLCLHTCGCDCGWYHWRWLVGGCALYHGRGA